MKLLVISDTHGQLKRAKEICELVDDADLIIHLGDDKKDAQRLAEDLKRPVEWVNGNCDFGKEENDSRILETDFGRVYLTHGHNECVKFGLSGLVEKAKASGCKAAFFGHTHIAGFQQIGGIYVLNPGSLTFPRDGSRGTYAVVHTGEARFEASILPG